MCRLLGVSSSGYHAWVKRQPSRRAETDAALTVEIRAAHAASRGTYGAPRIHAELAAKGTYIGRKRVARLMTQAGLAGVSRRRFVTTTVRGDRRQAPDLVERNFRAEAPDRLFATLECELLARSRFKTPAEARSAVFSFIEGFYDPRRRHSSIGYHSPIDFERRHQAASVVAGAHQPAAVLAAVKDKPFGRPQEAAVLDCRCARRPQPRAGRDGRMAPPGAEPKNVSTQEDSMPSNHTA